MDGYLLLLRLKWPIRKSGLSKSDELCRRLKVRQPENPSPFLLFCYNFWNIHRFGMIFKIITDLNLESLTVLEFRNVSCLKAISGSHLNRHGDK